MKEVRIGDRLLGDGQPCFIIAEAGSNHNGSLEHAKRLIAVAADAGVDAVKFQTFRAAKLYTAKAGTSDYLGIAKPIYDIIAQFEMPYEWIPELAECCKERSVAFLSSPFDEESADRLDAFMPAYKVASYEMTHMPFVRHIARKGKPVLVSTGAGNLEEVEETVAAFRDTANDQLVLLQCTASYPAPPAALNLRTIPRMQQHFGLPVGLSDHSRDPLVGPLAAVALGANVIEKHFTLSNELPGPDHRFAIEPLELRTMVCKIRELEEALGSGQKVVQQAELELRSFARRSVFATRDIEPGELFSPDNVAVLRCGKAPAGLEPKYFDLILNRRCSRSIAAGAAIRADDYE